MQHAIPQGLHGVNTLQSMGKRSIPRSRKSAFLDLFVFQNQKDRLLQEKTMLRIRRKQVDRRLSRIEKEMTLLLNTALQDRAGKRSVVKSYSKSTVLNY